MPKKIDGSGSTLPHAYFPEGDKYREIHMDSEERCYFGVKGNDPDNQSNFLMTMVYEIAHILG